jgi:SDR family mycofactocin-dependent oxidoreductase
MPEYDFSGQVAFITGAAHGQGRSHAKHYAKNGADVVAIDIAKDLDTVPYALGTKDELEQTTKMVEEEGQDALALEVDIRDEEQVEEAVGAALDEFGRIDFLANNAGVVTNSDATKLNEETWDEVVDTCLKGAWLCSKHVGRHFAERDDGGTIITTSSQAGLTGNPGTAHYVSAKWGVIGLTKTLALELAEYDVNVNAVSPSVVNTQMVDGLLEAYGEESLNQVSVMGGPMNVFDPEDPGIDPRYISEAYMWLSSDAADYVTGIVLPVDTGHTAK